MAAKWLPLEPDLYLGSPSGDLAALAALTASPEWQAGTGAPQRRRLRRLLEAMLPLLQRQLESAEQQPEVKKARLGPFQSAAVKPRSTPAAPRTLTDQALTQQVQQALQQLQRALPRLQAHQRQQRIAAAFAAAEVRARRQRWRDALQSRV